MIRNLLSTLDDAPMQENVPAEPAASLPSHDIAAGEIEKDGNDTNVNQNIRLNDYSSSLPSSSQTTSARKRRRQTEAVSETRQVITSEVDYKSLRTSKLTKSRQLITSGVDCRKSLRNSKPTEKPSHETFGDMMSHEIKELPAKQLLFCKKVINEAIFEASMGRLTEFSRIINIQKNILRK